ncbi:type I restriction endonuclease subunit R [Acuticoccus kalidii]|uniref:type I restriction endonuclease subunit R n=1 Tax=Acuticoccus kalidii TaxID=2910977 RepID=UPI003F70C6D2
MFEKARLINRLRNRAVHEERTITDRDALGAVTELFHVTFWLARTYARRARPADGLAFDPAKIPTVRGQLALGLSQLKRMQAELEARDGEVRRAVEEATAAEARARAAEDEAAAKIRAAEARAATAEEEAAARLKALDNELARTRAEIAAVRAANQATPDTHDYNEAETRDRFIDLLLKEAGWTLDGPNDLEFEVDGMPTTTGKGYVDYVLWGADGLPLGLVEAKRTKNSAGQGQQQAKLYADRLEARYGRRPVIFLSNGYEHWIWNDVTGEGTGHPPHQIGGFYKRDELELAIQRRTTRKPLPDIRIDRDIAGRTYQMRAIGNIKKAFQNGERKALLVMATGSGKTRTVIALVDVLMRAGWVKRCLFLADRTSLVKQATNAFKAHLPDCAPVNLVTERTAEGRVFLSTYPTMMNLIDGKGGRAKPFGPGHFDLVVIDEAHRSVYQRYRAIFDYFDSYLVGLTATPKEEIDRNTYSLFDLEDGVPTDAYTLKEAVRDGHLVPPHSISVPLKIVQRGLKYEDLSDEEKDQWDALEWGEDEIPDHVDPAEVNKRLFNEDTVDRVIAHVMERGIKVEGGDRLGKTIIFAKNQDHAEYIERRFNAAYPHLAGHFARVITHKTDHAQSLIDEFSIKDANPHIAISVDMLDTGIDVPEVVNLVFFKLVRSKTKFWQMMGRGTRLCPDLFGPGQRKSEFRVIDYCGNLEFFGSDPELRDDPVGRSLKARVFAARVDLLRALGRRQTADDPTGLKEDGPPFEAGLHAPPETERAVGRSLLAALQDDVAGMNPESFVVRQKRRLVEKYVDPKAWLSLDDHDREELVEEVAPLPSARREGSEGAKRFDLLMYQLTLALLDRTKAYDALRKRLIEIAEALEMQTAIPAVARHAELIEAIQTEIWWEGLTVPTLELVRLRLRNVVEHIDRSSKNIVYTDFADEIGTEVEHDLPAVGDVDFERFKRKARDFLRTQEDTVALQKLKRGLPLTQADLDSLATMLVDAGIGDAMTINAATQVADGFGLFIRGLVGLERNAVEQAFSDLVADGAASPDQLEFIGLVIDHLTDRGTMDPALLYESPFTDIAPHGPDQVFDINRAGRIVQTIQTFNNSAVA